MECSFGILLDRCYAHKRPFKRCTAALEFDLCSLENANTICRLFNIDRVFGKQHVKVTVTKCEIGYETQAAVSRLLVDNEVFAYGEGKSW